MKIDVLNLVLPDADFRAGFYLDGEHPSIQYLGPPNADGLQEVAYIKSLSGWPIDGMIATATSINQRVTENVWADPTSAKIVLGLGVPRMPRFIEYSPNQPAGIWGTGPNGALALLKPPQTMYFILGPGLVPTGKSDNKICRCSLRGPFPGTAVGDLPAGEDWEEWYERGSSDGVTFPQMEKVTHRVVRNADGSVVKGFGRRMWEQFKWGGTGYVADINPKNGLPFKSEQTKIRSLASPVIPVNKIF